MTNGKESLAKRGLCGEAQAGGLTKPPQLRPGSSLTWPALTPRMLRPHTAHTNGGICAGCAPHMRIVYPYAQSNTRRDKLLISTLHRIDLSHRHLELLLISCITCARAHTPAGSHASRLLQQSTAGLRMSAQNWCHRIKPASSISVYTVHLNKSMY